MHTSERSGQSCVFLPLSCGFLKQKLEGWKSSTISVSLDFLQCVQIFLSSKKNNLCSMSRFTVASKSTQVKFSIQIYVLEKRKIWTQVCQNLEGQILLRVSKSGF